MSKEKKLRCRIIGTLLITLGAMLGVTWNAEKYCIGDILFTALGFPAWSNGTTGTHYPAFIGLFMILIGMTFINYTLQSKARSWLWITVVAILIVLNMIFQ